LGIEEDASAISPKRCENQTQNPVEEVFQMGKLADCPACFIKRGEMRKRGSQPLGFWPTRVLSGTFRPLPRVQGGYRSTNAPNNRPQFLGFALLIHKANTLGQISLGYRLTGFTIDKRALANLDLIARAELHILDSAPIYLGPIGASQIPKPPLTSQVFKNGMPS
jgi:hypothetical protein